MSDILVIVLTVGVALILGGIAIGFFAAVYYSQRPTSSLYNHAANAVYAWGGGKNGLAPQFCRYNLTFKAAVLSICAVLLIFGPPVAALLGGD